MSPRKSVGAIDAFGLIPARRPLSFVFNPTVPSTPFARHLSPLSCPVSSGAVSLASRLRPSQTAVTPGQPASRCFFVSADTPSVVNTSEAKDTANPSTSWEAELLYDGDCPVCVRNVELLHKLDRRHRLRFVDISSPLYEPEEHGGVELEDAMDRLHAVLGDGRVVDGMDALRHVYRTMGLGWLVAPTGWPLLRGAFDALYDFVSSNRYTLLGQKRCDDDCRYSDAEQNSTNAAHSPAHSKSPHRNS